MEHHGGVSEKPGEGNGESRTRHGSTEKPPGEGHGETRTRRGSTEKPPRRYSDSRQQHLNRGKDGNERNKDKPSKYSGESHAKGDGKENSSNSTPKKSESKRDRTYSDSSDTRKERKFSDSSSDSKKDRKGSDSHSGDSKQGTPEPKTPVESEAEKEKRLKDEEAEKQRIEEELRKKEEEEKAQKIAEELAQITEFIAETKEKFNQKFKLRQENTNIAESRPDDSFFTKLDSSLKKNTAFVKKIKNMTETQRESLIKDLNSLNLTKYIGEVAAAITDAKLKMSDINCAIQICSLLHQRYSEFSTSLLENWQRVLPSKKDDKIHNPSKFRVDFRFFADLVAAGIFTERIGLNILSTQLSLLINNDKEEHNNATILISFCKHCGEDWAGLIPRKYRLLAEKFNLEIPHSQVLAPERQKACRNLLKDYCNSLCKHLVKDHKELQTMEKNNRRILHTKGELSQERKEKCEAAYAAYQKLLTNTQAFCEVLDEDLPDLPVEEGAKDDLGVGISIPPDVEYQYDGDSALFEDEDTKAFYESLYDLKAMVPGILYKDSVHATDPVDSTVKEEAVLEDEEELNVEDVEKEIEETSKELDQEPVAPKSKEEELVVEDLELQNDADEDDTNQCMKLILESFISSLPKCVNRDLIDKAALDFCMNLNTKANRKKLVRALFTVQRTRYDLLPFYSRLIANLNPLMPEVAQELTNFLSGDFKWHVRKKDQINIESKLKTVRFIGELVKFKIFPKSDALQFLKMLLFDFSHHNIEMACALLESCGRFLYRSPDSHHRTKIYLDVMARKKAALHLDVRYTTMIENAYYYCNPPELSPSQKKERPPMHEYIRKLLYHDLTKNNVEKVLRQVRKLDWDNQEIVSYAAKCLASVGNVRYMNIHCLANLLAGLAPYHDLVAIRVVDSLLEDIRLGLEVNIPKFNQRRISCAKYLGELYNYRMVESSVIFKTLYSFITFGVYYDDEFHSSVDPPEHLFRLRLVCVLLDTCGQYFDRGSSKKKLDYFLVYFYKYYWFKKKNKIWVPFERPFPLDVENMITDTVESIRPKLKNKSSNYEEALKAVEDLENELKEKYADMFKEPEVGGDDNLHTIVESEENEEHSQNLSQVPTDDEKSSQDSEDHCFSRTPSQNNEDEDDNENDENEHDDDDELDSAVDDDLEDDIVVTVASKKIECPEDDDFMAAFDKIVLDSFTTRTQEAIKAPQVDINLPIHVKEKQKKAVAFTGVIPQPVEEVVEDDSTINFTLISKKGNKQQLSSVVIPIDASFATKHKERQQAELVEKERLKRVVLDIHERQEEEDYQEMIAGLNRPLPLNANRERRVRYQHPKGAPDADAIFGSKKR